MINIPFSMTILLTFFIFQLSATSRLYTEQRKHDVHYEIWSFVGQMRTGEKDTSYVAVFLYSGRMLFLNGNFVQICHYNTDSGSFHYSSKVLLPPKAVVKHDYSKLNERFGDLTLQALDSVTLNLQSKFDLFKGSFRLSVQKSPLWFDEIFDRPMEKSKFDWYIFPRLDVDMQSTDRKPSGKGSGYFQQFWGSKAGQFSDWIVIQLQSGYEVFIAYFHDRKDNPWLPSSYVFICYPSGTRRKIEHFDYKPLQWWQKDTKKYPVKIKISIPDEKMEITVKAFRKDQTISAAGIVKWCGFGRVDASIKGKTQRGWAYFSPMGRK